MSEYNIFNGWDDQPTEQYFKILDDWFNSTLYEEMTTHADNGCEDSIQVVEKIHSYLDSAHFHLHNGSTQKRIDYELNQFADYVKEYLQ